MSTADTYRNNGNCELCHRKVALTLHHLIPRKLHRRNFFKKNYTRQQLQCGIKICRVCHSGIHRLYDEMTLGKKLNTLELLKADVAVSRHVAWVAKQKHATS